MLTIKLGFMKFKHGLQQLSMIKEELKMEISKEFAQQLVAYLATKPYVEVFRFIGEMERINQGQIPKGQKKEQKEPPSGKANN